jgi:hypothetical protein
VRRGHLLVDAFVPLTTSTVAKKRWISLRAVAHGFKASSVGTWKSLVAGAKVAVELKQIMNFQRASAQANSLDVSSMSTSDLVLAFVKDSVPATFMRCGGRPPLPAPPPPLSSQRSITPAALPSLPPSPPLPARPYPSSTCMCPLHCRLTPPLPRVLASRPPFFAHPPVAGVSWWSALRWLASASRASLPWQRC